MNAMPWSVFIAVLVAAVSAAPANEKVDVAVYYETFCPDSRKFITEQLMKAIESPLAREMNLNLIPFGKSDFTYNQTSNTYNFTCDHGEEECYGNKIHACAIKHFNNNTSQIYKFINCTMAMAEKGKEYPLKMCIDSLMMSGEEIISTCALNEGDSLLAEMGNMTKMVGVTSVPTIIFNNMKDANASDMAKMDFKKELCSRIKGQKPTECMAAPSSANFFTLATPLIPAIASLILARL